MGNERWTKILRFVLCVIVTVLLMILAAPKAC